VKGWNLGEEQETTSGMSAGTPNERGARAGGYAKRPRTLTGGVEDGSFWANG
jgi:hypothetical protein